MRPVHGAGVTPGRPVFAAFPHVRTPWRAIAAECRAAVERGDLAPSALLPPLGELCAVYGVSHNTARKAMKYLAGEGLIAPGA